MPALVFINFYLSAAQDAGLKAKVEQMGTGMSGQFLIRRGINAVIGDNPDLAEKSAPESSRTDSKGSLGEGAKKLVVRVEPDVRRRFYNVCAGLQPQVSPSEMIRKIVDDIIQKPAATMLAEL